MKLKNHPYSNCFVEKEDGGALLKFYSYDTLVVVAVFCEDMSWDIHFNKRFSRTTSKQIRWFLMEYFPAVYDMKIPFGDMVNTQDLIY